MKIYKMATGWAIFVYIFASLLIALFLIPIALWLIPAWRDSSFEQIKWIIVPISLGMIVTWSIALIDTAIGRVWIDEERIQTRYLLATRSMAISDIRGFRINEHYILIESKTRGVKRLRISRYYAPLDELLAWLFQGFPNLDELQSTEAYEQLKQNRHFGSTENDRIERLRQAKRAVLVFNWVGGISAGWILLGFPPRGLVFGLGILLPWVGIFLLNYFRGMTRIDEDNTSPYPSILLGFMFPSLAILVRGILGINLQDHGPVWVPVLGIALVMSLAMIIYNPEFKGIRWKGLLSMLMVFALSTGYSYGTLVSLNVSLDRSTPVTVRSTIIDKHVTEGKTTLYYFMLAPWQKNQSAQETKVSKTMYHDFEVGDSIQIHQYKGWLGWEYIELGW